MNVLCIVIYILYSIRIVDKKTALKNKSIIAFDTRDIFITRLSFQTAVKLTKNRLPILEGLNQRGINFRNRNQQRQEKNGLRYHNMTQLTKQREKSN